MDPRPLKANICIKGVHAPAGFSHPERVLYPLKRTGPRGSGQWQRVSGEQAMDDIGARLSAIVAKHGAEALAVSTSQWQTDNGAARRFLNLLGSPNWISGVALCSGHTAAINRMVYGWYPPGAGARRQTDRDGPAQKRELRARRSLAALEARHARTRPCASAG